MLNNPVSGGVVTSLSPSLSVRNAADPDGDALYYDFELYSDSSLENLEDTGLIGEGELVTSWRVSATLSDASTYYWRARAYDGILEGAWTPTAVFSVQTEGAATVVNTVASVDVAADSTEDQEVGVTDEASPINGVSITIPPGAVSEDCTVTIGWVENPPALPDGSVALGHILEFGPHGMEFSAPVTVRIPYTQNDLEASGVSDPSELSVMTFNAATLSWESIPVDSVDTEGGYLVMSVDHFSLYTKTYVSQNDSSSQSGGGGSGGCFIDTLGSMVSGRLCLAVFVLLLSVVGLSGDLRRKG